MLRMPANLLLTTAHCYIQALETEKWRAPVCGAQETQRAPVCGNRDISCCSPPSEEPHGWLTSPYTRSGSACSSLPSRCWHWFSGGPHIPAWPQAPSAGIWPHLWPSIAEMRTSWEGWCTCQPHNSRPLRCNIESTIDTSPAQWTQIGIKKCSNMGSCPSQGQWVEEMNSPVCWTLADKSPTNECDNLRTHSASMGHLQSSVKTDIQGRLEPWYQQLIMCHVQAAPITRKELVTMQWR